MTNQKFVELDRHFNSISAETKIAEDYESRIALGLSESTKWPDLLKEFRVVILAEAGAGKTEEIREATVKLQKQGKAAFFIRLEFLTDGIEDAFDKGNTESFQQWKNSSDEAWIFLDSVDEARLGNPKDFEKAIRVLSRELGDSAQRAHIFITSRITEWRPSSDLNLIKNKLPYKKPAQITQENNSSFDPDVMAEELFEDAESIETKADDDFEKPRIYALGPLNDKQIRIFANASGINDCDDFIDSIERNDASVFASRPLDLVDLIDFWKEQKRIGSRSELIRANIDRKLKEYDPDRAQARPLSIKKASEGAHLLAAATTLQKTSIICIPDREENKSGVNATEVLHGWTEAECSALLSRPIFDEAIYGTVRFHHRSVREFLTAEWLFELLKDGKSRRQVEKLLFRKQYGVEVVVPTMRPIVPWLAILDEHVREKVRSISPEILLEGGDPAQLPSTARIQILNSICKQYDSDSFKYISIDSSAVQRFAKPDIAVEIKALLAKYREHKELRFLFLRMVWQGELQECSDDVQQIALDKSMDDYTRIVAIRAIAAIGSKANQKELLKDFIKSPDQGKHRILKDFIDSFSPGLMTTKHLLSALKKTRSPSRYEHTGLSHSLDKHISQYDPDKLIELIHGLRLLLDTPPFIEPRHYDVSERYSWLLDLAISACEKLVHLKHPNALSTDSLTIISLSSLAHNYDSHRHRDNKLHDLVRNWAELNYQLFWHDVASTRQRLDEKKDERLTDWWRVRVFRDYWCFEARDFEKIKEDISAKQLLDDKLVALSLAFDIYKKNDRPRKWLTHLKQAVSGNPELVSALHNFLHPPPLSEEERKWRRTTVGFRRKEKAHEKKEAENHTNWKNWLQENHHILRDTSVAKKGVIWNAQLYLFHRLRELGTDSNRWAQTNWRNLIEDQSKKVAEAFRDGVVAYWRHYSPKIRSEGIKNTNSVPHGVVIGLSGLKIEANEAENWPNNLTSDEATLACRYALWEMNGFPTWLPRLYEAFPKIVTDCLLEEIRWELAEYDGESDSSYVLSDIAWHGSWIKSRLAKEIFCILKKYDPKHDGNLTSCFNIVLGSETISDSDISILAKDKLKGNLSEERQALWFAVWVSVDPDEAVDALEKHLLIIIKKNVDATQFAMLFLANLLGERHNGIQTRENFKTAGNLKRLYILMHKYVREKDDVHRTGSYSPALRDDAQEARNKLFSLLKEIPGKTTYLAILDIAKSHPNLNTRSWMRQNARNRAETDSDFEKWSAEDVRMFAKESERKPNNHIELFNLAIFRLFDLKDDLEDGDSSNASILIKANQETDVRKFIGNWLRDHSLGRYSIPQEEELADAKRPDLKMHGAGFDGPVPIELKIADKWSGSSLFERLENQLCNDYLRDRRSNSGIYLLVFRDTKQTWVHPLSKEKLVFSKLIEALQVHANDYISTNEQIEKIEVIGIDLTKRNK